MTTYEEVITEESLLNVINKEVTTRNHGAVIDFIKFYFNIADCFKKIYTLRDSIIKMVKDEEEKVVKLTNIQGLVCKIYSKLYATDTTQETLDQPPIFEQFYDLVADDINKSIVDVETKFQVSAQIDEAESNFLTEGIHYFLKSFRQSASTAKK